MILDPSNILEYGGVCNGDEGGPEQAWELSFTEGGSYTLVLTSVETQGEWADLDLFVLEVGDRGRVRSGELRGPGLDRRQSGRDLRVFATAALFSAGGQYIPWAYVWFGAEGARSYCLEQWKAVSSRSRGASTLRPSRAKVRWAVDRRCVLS